MLSGRIRICVPPCRRNQYLCFHRSSAENLTVSQSSICRKAHFRYNVFSGAHTADEKKNSLKNGTSTQKHVSIENSI